MAAKAVYQNKHVAVYIRQSDLDMLTSGFTITVPLYHEKDLKAYQGLRVSMYTGAARMVKEWRHG